MSWNAYVELITIPGGFALMMLGVGRAQVRAELICLGVALMSFGLGVMLAPR